MEHFLVVRDFQNNIFENKQGSMVQITHNLNGPCMSHTCDTCGVNHTCGGFLDIASVYMHMQYFTRMCFTCVHACMANVAS